MKESFVYMPASITQIAPVVWPRIDQVMMLVCTATYWSWVALKLFVDMDLELLWACIYEQVLQDFRYHF